jgi:aminoglycoside phosphotransferase (APT) family kinase protein
MTTRKPDARGTLATEGDIAAVAERVLEGPVRLAILKHKPSRRCTWLATSSTGSVIVKAYASDRAATVAARVAALAAGPDEPTVPEVLLVDQQRRLVILSEVPGVPLRAAILSGDLQQCRRAGAAMARWHRWWEDGPPAPLAHHTIDAELAALDRWLARLPAGHRRSRSAIANELAQPWPCTTAVHRDLYEEQVVLRERVGLIDLDDAAAGPPELDLGNLAAHLDLLALGQAPLVARRGAGAFFAGYRTITTVDADRFERCRRLSLLRLACIHRDQRLVHLADGQENSMHQAATRSNW